MKTYKVHPAFEPENVLKVEAGGVKEAALAFLAKRPTRRSLFVSSDLLNEEIVDVEKLAEEFPELATLLDLSSPAIPNPRKVSEEEEESGASFFQQMALLRLKMVGAVLLVVTIFIPFQSHFPTALRIAAAIILVILAVAAVLVFSRRARNSGKCK